MSELETVMHEVAPDYYFMQPGSTRSGVRVFVEDMFNILYTPGLVPRAREAAQICEAEPVINPNAFQERLRAAVFDLYRRTVRPHPRLDDMAARLYENMGPNEVSHPLLQKRNGGNGPAKNGVPPPSTSGRK